MRKMSFADLMTEWQELLNAADAHGVELAASAPQREALRSQIEKVRATKGTQLSARATAQRSTQLLKQEIEEGQMMVIQLRSAVRAIVDPRNEGLVGFGVAPLRTRAGRSRTVTLGKLASMADSEGAVPEARPASPAPAGAPEGSEPAQPV